MSSTYKLACPSCGVAVPSDDVEWDGAEGAPADFGKCPKCGATSEADEWVEAEDNAPGVSLAPCEFSYGMKTGTTTTGVDSVDGRKG